MIQVENTRSRDNQLTSEDNLDVQKMWCILYTSVCHQMAKSNKHEMIKFQGPVWQNIFFVSSLFARDS